VPRRVLRRSGMARVLKGSHSFTCTPRVHPLTEWTTPAFSFSTEAGPHLPTPVGWKAELVTNKCRWRSPWTKYLCIISKYVVNFWGLRSQIPTGTPPVDPLGGLLFLRPYNLPTHGKYQAGAHVLLWHHSRGLFKLSCEV